MSSNWSEKWCYWWGTCRIGHRLEIEKHQRAIDFIVLKRSMKEHTKGTVLGFLICLLKSMCYKILSFSRFFTGSTVSYNESSFLFDRNNGQNKTLILKSMTVSCLANNSTFILGKIINEWWKDIFASAFYHGPNILTAVQTGNLFVSFVVVNVILRILGEFYLRLPLPLKSCQSFKV